MTPSHISILGLGRAGRALAHAARGAGFTLGPLWNRDPTRASEASAELGLEVKSGPELPSTATAELIFIAVADRAVAEVAASLATDERAPDTCVVAHLAGALDLTPLAPLSARGCAVGSLHPARALLGAATSLSGALCAIDGDARAVAALERVAAALGCDTARVSGEARALYHAGTALAANDIVALVEQATRTLGGAGVPAAAAQRAVLDLARGALANVERRGPAAALTGPVARGDVEVLGQHLAALAAVEPALAEVHRRLSLLLLDLCRQHGAPREQIEAVAALLAGDREPDTGEE